MRPPRAPDPAGAPLLNHGSSIGIAILGTASLERCLDFYAGQLGMDASAVAALGGAAFERHWGLPAGSTARAALLSVGGSSVGRVLAIEFDSPHARRVSDGTRGPFIGYWNLNFYVDEIEAPCRALAAQGYTFWSKPVRHAVAGGGGAPVEAIFLGPDQVAINLVELDGAPGSPIEAIWRETRELPRSRLGFSQVATSAHATRDVAAAARFHREVLGMWPAVDAVLDSPAANELTGRPREARTRVIWMRGDHPYGKVALSEPLNYTLVDRASDVVAPAIGYLAQSFPVADLELAMDRAAQCGAPVLGEPEDLELPGGLRLRACLLRAPGSGALLQLTQEADRP